MWCQVSFLIWSNIRNSSQRALQSVQHTAPSIQRPSIRISKIFQKHPYTEKGRNLRKANKGGRFLFWNGPFLHLIWQKCSISDWSLIFASDDRTAAPEILVDFQKLPQNQFLDHFENGHLRSQPSFYRKYSIHHLNCSFRSGVCKCSCSPSQHSPKLTDCCNGSADPQ